MRRSFDLVWRVVAQVGLQGAGARAEMKLKLLSEADVVDQLHHLGVVSSVSPGKPTMKSLLIARSGGWRAACAPCSCIPWRV